MYPAPQDLGAGWSSRAPANGRMSQDLSQLLIFSANKWPMTPGLLINEPKCQGLARDQLTADTPRGAGCGSLGAVLVPWVRSCLSWGLFPLFPEGAASQRDPVSQQTQRERDPCGRTDVLSPS